MAKVLAPSLREGRIRCAVNIASGSPIAVEVAGDLGFSAVAIDARHGPISPYSHELANLVRAARAAAVPAVARLPEATPGTINRALNDGVDGVIVPGIRTAEQARAVVMASRYPPVGQRGAAPVVRAAGYGVRDWDEYRDEANRDQLVLCSLESGDAVTAAAAILDIDGVDGVVLDVLSIAVEAGVTGLAPTDITASADACRAAVTRGKVCAAILPDAELAEAWAAVGCTLLIFESDLSVCLRAMRTARAAMGPKVEAI